MADKVGRRVKIGFGVGEFSSSIFFTVTSFWLMNFLTDEVRLSAALAGTALLVGKIWDAVIDPFIGHISDGTRSRWGRRRPYLVLFSIPFGIFFVLMFSNPPIEAQTAKFTWALVMYTLFCTVYSLTNIPYNALLPDLSQDYNERTNISGFKQFFAVIGTLVGAGAAMPIMALFATRTQGYVGMAAVFGVLGAFSLLVTFLSVREPEWAEAARSDGLLDALREVFNNKPYKALLTAWFVNSTAVAVMEAMLIYYYKYVFNAEGEVTMAMITLLVVTIITIPFWVWLAKHLSKKASYILGMTITLAAVVAFSFTADRFGTTWSLVYMAAAGFGFSAHYVLPWTMAPDTIDFGHSLSGQRREGVYYSVWTFVIAVGGALAGFLVGQVLGLFGYVPDTAQTARSLLGIRLLIGPLPAVLILAGNIAMAFYPINRRRHEEIQEQIRMRDTSKG